MQWSDLNNEQRVLLTAWYALAGLEQPHRTERLPIEYEAALREMVGICGVAPYRFKRRQVQLPRHRSPKVRRGKSFQLAS